MHKGRHAARGAASALVLCTLMVWSAAAAVAQDPTSGDVAELHYSPSEGPPGTAITITGRCLYEGRSADRAYVAMYDEPPTRDVASVSIPISADGAVHGSLQVPSSEPPGQYRLSGYCVKDDFTIGPAINAPFTVTDVTPTTAPFTIQPPTTVATTTTTATTEKSPTTVPATTVLPTTVPATTVLPTTAPTTTVASAASVSSDGAGIALPALAAAGAVAGAAVLWVRHQRRRTQR